MKAGESFEHLVLNLVKKMGFEAEMTKSSGDGGVDIVAFNNQPMMKGKYIIQCKDWSSPVGEPPLRDLYGVLHAERANKGILITTSEFTANARRFADGKPLELIDGNGLAQLLESYGLYDAEKNDMVDSPIREDELFSQGMAQLVSFETNSKDEYEDCSYLLYSFGKLTCDKDFKFESDAGSVYMADIRYLEIAKEIDYKTNYIYQIIEMKLGRDNVYYNYKFKCSQETMEDTYDQLSSLLKKQSKQCFVATEIYGSNSCIQVEKLRKFRDTHLCKSNYGRAFISYYYDNGEKWAHYLKSRNCLKGLIKGFLDILIYILK